MLRVSVSVVVAVLVHVILSTPSYGAESKMERWYTLWNIGYGQNGYPLELQEVLDEINDQPNVEHSVGMTVADVLGFYVPLGEQTLIGTIINANADVYEWKDGETQVDIYNYIWGASVIHFPNAKIGQGGFVRTDLGLAFVSAEVFYDNKIEQVQSDLGVGVLAGGGYAWPIAEGTRLMGGLQFALRRVEKDYYMSFGLTLGALF